MNNTEIFEVNKKYKPYTKELHNFLKNFKKSGRSFIEGGRNSIKLFDLDDNTINVKSFKVPKFYNKIGYGYIRKSKAERSFEFANRLLEMGIGTPEPIAFYENKSILGLNESYFVSEHLNADFTFRELVQTPERFQDLEEILNQFTRFCFKLHQKGVEFLDHTPGNTLIIKNERNFYDFYLVDLNRMKFHKEMSLDLRLKNLCRLTPKEETIAIISLEYSKLSGEKYEVVFEKLWNYTKQFQEAYFRKKRIKAKLKFKK